MNNAATGEKLILPRRLAIELLAHAQQSLPDESWLGYLTGAGPESLDFHPGEPGSGVPVWALVRPQAAGPGGAGGRLLTVELDTKGVLQLRCWNAQTDPPTEQPLEIR